MPEGQVLQEAQWYAQLHGRGLSGPEQMLPLLISFQLLAKEERGLVPPTLPAPGSLYQPVGTGPCCPHHKTPSYPILQVHSLNAACTLELCPDSPRLRRWTCSRKLLLVVLSDAVLPVQKNSTVSERPCPPLFLLPQPQSFLTVGWEETPPAPTLPCCSFLAEHQGSSCWKQPVAPSPQELPSSDLLWVYALGILCQSPSQLHHLLSVDPG